VLSLCSGRWLKNSPGTTSGSEYLLNTYDASSLIICKLLTLYEQPVMYNDMQYHDLVHTVLVQPLTMLVHRLPKTRN